MCCQTWHTCVDVGSIGDSLAVPCILQCQAVPCIKQCVYCLAVPCMLRCHNAKSRILQCRAVPCISAQSHVAAWLLVCMQLDASGRDMYAVLGSVTAGASRALLKCAPSAHVWMCEGSFHPGQAIAQRQIKAHWRTASAAKVRAISRHCLSRLLLRELENVHGA